jgi:aminoglycoside phosphotransferase (APT) family kinase protein
VHPPADITVTVPLVRRLLREQHPDLAPLPLRVVANGWDNVMLRLGDDLVVRMPRREVAAHLVAHEQRWLPTIRMLVGDVVAVPAPVRIGRPSDTYPWPWSVVPWVHGVPAGPTPVDAPAVVDALADFVDALHVPAPADAPHNPVRGGPLAGRSHAVAERLASGAVPRADAVAALWGRAVAVPGWAGPPVWLHGDLHPFNLVVDDDRLVAVVDFGDVTAGDPATDLATAWLTFGREARVRFRARLAADDATWMRARGWAVAMATALATGSAEGSDHHSLAVRAIDAVLDD